MAKRGGVGTKGGKVLDKFKCNTLAEKEQLKIVGGKGKPVRNAVHTTASKNIKIVGDQYLKKNNINAHALKKEWLDRNTVLKNYDIYRNTSTGELMIFRKGGVGDGIHTGEFIK